MRIEQESNRHIITLCSLLGYSRQAYYQQKRRMEQDALWGELVIQRVLEIRGRQPKIGTRKLQVILEPFLKEHGISMGRDALFELFSDNGLLIRKRRRKAPRTTFSDHWLRKHPNLIEDMVIESPNTLWVSDITYITMKSGFSYLSLITDAYSRKIVGYCLSKSLATEGCVKALKMALKALPKGSSLIHHSDRGCQYCSAEYVEQLTARDISISMTQNSDPRENAIAERVNGVLKGELLADEFSSFETAKTELAKAISIYNCERPHSSVDMLTPSQAHRENRKLSRRWKNYYTNKEKEVPMT